MYSNSAVLFVQGGHMNKFFSMIAMIFVYVCASSSNSYATLAAFMSSSSASSTSASSAHFQVVLGLDAQNADHYVKNVIYPAPSFALPLQGVGVWVEDEFDNIVSGIDLNTMSISSSGTVVDGYTFVPFVGTPFLTIDINYNASTSGNYRLQAVRILAESDTSGFGQTELWSAVPMENYQTALVALTTPPVPEPTTVGFIGGLAVVALRRHRNFRNFNKLHN